MDNETRALLPGVLQFLDKQEQIIEQAMVVSLSLRKAMKELDPKFESLYAKHYADEIQSQGAKANEGFRGVLAGLIQRLNSPGAGS